MPWNQKLEPHWFFQEYQSTRHQKIVEKDTSQDKFWLMPCKMLHHKMLFFHWKHSVQTRDWHSYAIDPASYWANIFLYFFESKYIQQIFKWSSRAYKFHGTSRFIDDLCTANDDGGELSSSYKYIYSKQLEIKLGHQRELATFFDLDITIKNNIFMYKLFDKRDNFPLIYCTFICRVIFHHQYSMVQYSQSSYK